MQPNQPQHKIKLTEDDVYRYLSEQVFVTSHDSYVKNPKWPGLVGLEIEMLPIVVSSEFPPKLAKREQVLETALLEVAKDSRWGIHYDQAPFDDKILSIDLGENDQITFEPGGQLEISTKPYGCLSDAMERLTFLQNKLDRYLGEAGLELCQLGMNPWYTPNEIGLQIKKSRYQAMTKYFAGINDGIGLRMMRQTCTVQINLDFGPDETTLAKRYLASQILAPIAGGIFAFSPYCDGKLTPFRSMRTEVWRLIDKGRTGFPPLQKILKNLDHKSCVEVYYDFLMASPVIFVTGLQYESPEKPLIFREWLKDGYKGTYPEISDLKTCLSLLFPEVRARGFLELRSIDCQTRAWQFVPAAFYCALLYDEQNVDSILNWAEEFLQKNTLEDYWAKARFGLIESDLAKSAKHMMNLALGGFERLPNCFHGLGAKESLIAFSEKFTQNNQTPADALIEQCKKSGVQIPGRDELNLLNDTF